uniref:RNase H type-1 domain-containing protein n=1 Tax=Oryza brachyantha TaxID=4533 RepID=J3M4I9_ORYBR
MKKFPESSKFFGALFSLLEIFSGTQSFGNSEKEAIEVILQIQIIQQEGEDKLCRNHTSDGNCNTKSAYKEVMKHRYQTVAQDKIIPPRVKTFVWRLLVGALPTSLRLSWRMKDYLPTAPDAMLTTYTNINNVLVNQEHCRTQDLEMEQSGNQIERRRKCPSIPGGIRCYIDASWTTESTGLGLFIMATTLNAQSILQAELIALQLAMEVALFLDLENTIFLTDNEVIARTMTTRQFDQDPGHWSIRPWLSI